MTEAYSCLPAEELFDLFVSRTHALNGEVIRERKPWNTAVSSDAIRHFCDGIGDANPLWHKEPRFAPPAFLTSVLYPVIHGAPVEIPLSSLILDLKYHWYQPISLNDRLTATAVQKDAFTRKRADNARSMFIIGKIDYRNQHNKQIATAESTMMSLGQNTDDNAPAMLIDRSIHQYSTGDLKAIGKALSHEAEMLKNQENILFGDQLEIGTELPELVRGPLTIGDMICWQSAIGPSYRAGPAGYHDTQASPHTQVQNPVTGWRVKNSQEHEDFLLASHRGMPAPFDNGVMRFATLTPLLTNWMGKNGFLHRLSMQVLAPNLYGDTTWYRATITKKTPHTGSIGKKGYIFEISITGTNQLGEQNTLGEAEVFLPSKALSKPALPYQPLKPDNKIKDRYLHELTEQRLLDNSKKIALVAGQQNISSKDLQLRVLQISSLLNNITSHAEPIVGICIDRSSSDLIPGLLAILRVGGTYLPLDPELPEQRLKDILKDARLPFVLTQKCHRSKLADAGQSDSSMQIILIDEQKEEQQIIAKLQNPSETHAIPGTHPAYLLYTSGVTAQPKGVLVSHNSLSVYIQSIARTLPVSAKDTYLQTALLSFSAASRQIWLPLYLGARLVIATREQATDPIELFTLIKEQGITVWDTVPSILNMVIRSLKTLDRKTRNDLLDNDLRLIMTTGEPLAWNTIHDWRNLLPHQETEIINLYSQTETAGTVCFYPIPESSNQEYIVPLGKPIDNTQVHVLDDELHPVAEGETGEICVSGPRLSSKYRDQETLTAERFVIPGDGALAGIPLYRTRDLGRWSAKGVLEHQGRLENQLKIRGHRISPTEIELALLADVMVKEAAIYAVTDNRGDNKLIAWITLSESNVDTADFLENQQKLILTSLRQTLADKLPIYMIPAKFYIIHDMPRTPSGKVDRQALLASKPKENTNQGLPGSTQFNAEIQSPVVNKSLENELLSIWQKLLELDQVKPDDDFFTLGGDSLKAGELLAIIRGKYAASVSLRDFFRKPTINALQEAISLNDTSELTSTKKQEKLQDKLSKLADGL